MMAESKVQVPNVRDWSGVTDDVCFWGDLSEEEVEDEIALA